MKISPCKECTERHHACHDTCERYKEWKTKNVPPANYYTKMYTDKKAKTWYHNSLAKLTKASKERYNG